ncbi:response regulator [Candidatus Parcubacteria bacterium]|nr:MAG: response regulator [Candidatus Parcubacteria bacterium]
MSKAIKAKILLAEDDRFISLAYKDGLSRAGFEVVHAQDGEEAILKIKKEKPDLILLDLIMPDVNGFEVLKEIKQDKELSKIPVIILSNLGQDADIEKGKKLGAADYLIKANVSISEVVEKIKQFLKLQ